MSPFPVNSSIQRLLASVKKLEGTLRDAGLPRFLARLPVWWLCWHYCRVLDGKIARISRISGKFKKWLPVVTEMGQSEAAQTEMIDLDQSLRRDIEGTRNALLELRTYCLDIGRMFEQLGYTSRGLQRREQALLSMVDESCESARVLQAAVTAHDEMALAMLRAMQMRERAAAQYPAAQ